MRALLEASALHLAALIRSGEVSSREVVRAHVARIEEVNSGLNAVVAGRFEEALREADGADTRLRGGAPSSLPPLHGVPCTIKESFALEGMPNTAGLPARRGVPATHDATTVARLRTAGAIPLGVTNTSELCMWMESHNRVYGRTRNPYDPSRIVGGSSGGEGAIVGAGGSPFGLGSDIGGSIRMPAFFCGVFGHKPTGGMVPSTGQYPVAENAALRYLSTGPIARRAEDLMPLLRILAGPDGQDPACEPFDLGDPTAVDPGDLRVILVEDDGRIPVQPALRRAQARAAAHLEGLGAEIRLHRSRRLGAALEIWSSMMHEASETPFRTLLGDGQPIRPARELLRWTLGHSEHTLPSIVLAWVEDLPGRLGGTAHGLAGAGRRLRAELEELVGEKGVLLYPPFPRVAPRHNAPLRRPLQWVYTAIFNVLELPVTQVPLGLDRGSGLPLGVQVAARRGHDHLSIAAALELERAFGGWTPPPGPETH